MTTALYEIGTSEGDDGSTHPAECIWTLGEDAEEAAASGFVIHRSLYIAGSTTPPTTPTRSASWPSGITGGATSSTEPPRTWHGSTAGGLSTSTRDMTRWSSSPASRAPSRHGASSYGTRTLVYRRSLTGPRKPSSSAMATGLSAAACSVGQKPCCACRDHGFYVCEPFVDLTEAWLIGDALLVSAVQVNVLGYPYPAEPAGQYCP